MKNQYVLKRHKVFRKYVGSPFLFFQKRKYDIAIDKFNIKDGEQYFILSNHQTAGDQFFVSMAFNGAIYFVASEDIFTNGLPSKLLRYFVGPIPIKKNATDVRAVKQIMRVAKEGGSIAIFPEGNRTFSGTTGYMNPAIAKLAKSIKIPIAIFVIEGGYGKMPRWSDVIRKGQMKAGVKRIITPEEYGQMSDDELLKEIRKYLYVDESLNGKSFYHKNSAEFVERFLYYCPYCGFSTIRSHKNMISCTKCGKTIEYLPDSKLKGIDFDFKYNSIKEWYDGQENYINGIDLKDKYGSDVIYTDNIRLISVKPYEKKVELDAHAFSKLYEDKIEVIYKNGNLTLPFSDITAISVVDRNKLNIYQGEKVYQFKGDRRFNPLKYMHFYYKKQHELNGEADNKFLGL